MEQDSSGIASATICQIQKAAPEFLDREVQVRAIYINGFEMFVLQDFETCNADKTNSHGIMFRFDEGYENRTSKKVMKRFDKLLARKLENGAFVKKVSGSFVVKVEKYVGITELDHRAEFYIVVMRMLSADERVLQSHAIIEKINWR